MEVIHTIEGFRRYRRGMGREVRTSFVPTMGALHEGHASLVREARGRMGGEGKVFVSIFVNPTQFGPNEDYGKYPRTLEADLAICERSGADAVFVPSAAEMYPGLAGAEGGRGRTQDLAGMTSVEPGAMAGLLEGAIRPGHFRGVCTVVAKLLNIVEPGELLMGQKDYQQQAILRQMCRDLDMPVEVVTCATVREGDGLAMSSRNRYLSVEERGRAVALYEALTWAKGAYGGGERRVEVLERGMRERVAARGLEVQYTVAVDAGTLRGFEGGVVEGKGVLLVAAKLGGTRLIDNMVL